MAETGNSKQPSDGHRRRAFGPFPFTNQRAACRCNCSQELEASIKPAESPAYTPCPRRSCSSAAKSDESGESSAGTPTEPGVQPPGPLGDATSTEAASSPFELPETPPLIEHLTGGNNAGGENGRPELRRQNAMIPEWEH